MKTIIEDLKQKRKDVNLIEKVDDVEDELRDAKYEIDELKDELRYALTQSDFDTYNTGLGKILVYNKTGNIILQQELDDFFESLKQKYL